MRQLRQRAQFVRAARGSKANGRFFVLQAAACVEPDAGIGYTVTKRVGNAPERNRIKRRLRAAVRQSTDLFRPNTDYVLIGRRPALYAQFDELLEALGQMVQRLNPAIPTR
ncbi:MAG: ribonuclease P protein component [Hyphomicrobiaceae bacterium]|nr:ribonuclease P protein component [Hyphomicrobiaceae bacterium]MCC0022660.1 ribonuclease P protein component [Hyphomicrobiaceae bacterium]